MLEYVLLGLLSYRPFTGYDLGKWVESEGQFLRSRLHHSQIYRLLARMVTDGLIVYDVDPRESRPDAKVYRLTQAGGEALLDWVRSPYKPTSRFQDPDFVTRFTFAAALDRPAAIRLIRTELDYRRAQIAHNRDRDRTFHFRDPLPEVDQDLALDVLEQLHLRGASAMDTWVSWLERMLRRLEDWPQRDNHTPTEKEPPS